MCRMRYGISSEDDAVVVHLLVVSSLLGFSAPFWLACGVDYSSSSQTDEADDRLSVAPTSKALAAAFIKNESSI
jgi:hypothetical protein